MSPYEAWTKASAVSCIRLPRDPDELDVVCCDAVSCTLTVRGVVLENCLFNSPELQAILREAPTRPSKRAGRLTDSIAVQARFNGSLMDAIWVLDPRTSTRIRVPNIDPVKAKLSSYQISVAMKIQRKAQALGQKIAIGQAIERARNAARELQFARSLAARRRALKILGLSGDEAVEADSSGQSAAPAHPLSGPLALPLARPLAPLPAATTAAKQRTRETQAQKRTMAQGSPSAFSQDPERSLERGPSSGGSGELRRLQTVIRPRRGG